MEGSILCLGSIDLENLKGKRMSKDSRIRVGAPKYNGKRYEISFTVPVALRSYFKTESFWFECPDAGRVSDSIALVPVVANLLPFAWVFDCSLEVPCLDAAFVEAVPKIKQGYVDMLPNVTLGGCLNAHEVVSCETDLSSDCCGSPLLLFSGGADAWCTFVRHVDERPHLVSIWGADIGCSNVSGWVLVDGHSNSVAKAFDVDYSYIKSNFKEMIDYRKLDKSPIMKKAGYAWWHDVQHGIGLLSLAAPLGSAKNARRIYIASSNTEKDKGSYVCASDPTIDNLFVAGQLRGYHDAYELTRQGKIDEIVRYAASSSRQVNMRVCYHVETGRNCCHCEKCARTILEILAASGNPRDFGFDYSPGQFNLLMWRMRHIFRLTYPFYYHDIAEAVRERGIELPPSARWVLSDDIDRICDNKFKRGWERFHKFGANIYHSIRGRVKDSR